MPNQADTLLGLSRLCSTIFEQLFAVLQPRTKLLRHFNAIFNFAPWYHRVQKKQIRPPPHPRCNVVSAYQLKRAFLVLPQTTLQCVSTGFVRRCSNFEQMFPF